MTTINAPAELPALQLLIDAMQDAVAIVAPDGTILAVNKTWRQFSVDNGGDQSSHYIGTNYLGACEGPNGASDDLAGSIAQGLRDVLNTGTDFITEYPCHTPTEKRWFEVVANPFDIDGERYALVAHRNITTRKLAQVEVAYAEQNAQNLAAIVTTMPDAVIAFDLDGQITSWNPAAETLYGYTREEAIGQSMEMLYPPDWPKRITTYIAEIIVSELKNFDVIRKTKWDELRTIAVTAAPIRSRDGDIIGISNVHRDVTVEREAEQKLRSVLNNLFAFVGILDPDGTLLEANKAPLQAAGLKAKDVIGKKFWECYWWTYDDEVAQQLQSDIARVLEGETVRYDTQVQVANGQLVWIDFQMAPMRDATGNIVNVVPSGIDISDRKAAVEKLEQSHETFKNLVDRSPFGVYTVDADFRLAHVSQGASAAFANVNPLIGHDFSDVMHTLWPDEFAEEAIARFRHTLATGEPYHAEPLVEQRLDVGEVESYDWMIERIVMPDGRLGVVCNFYDLSEREKYEQHIRLLMSEVNHRSKNLLAVVLSMARQTARNSTPSEFVELFSQRLLGLSTSQNLIIEGSWSGVSITNLAEMQLKHLGPEILGQRIKMDGPDITVSPTAAEGIGMALHELSTNALKYGALSVPEGGVDLVWSIDQNKDAFKIQWREHDGPEVVPPTRTGFGRTVIERMAANSVDGSVDIKYATSGLVWQLKAPLEDVEQARDS